MCEMTKCFLETGCEMILYSEFLWGRKSLELVCYFADNILLVAWSCFEEPSDFHRDWKSLGIRYEFLPQILVIDLT